MHESERWVALRRVILALAVLLSLSATGVLAGDPPYAKKSISAMTEKPRNISPADSRKRCSRHARNKRGTSRS